MKKFKINLINGRFWFYPNIFTLSKRKWVPRPYSNLKKLLVFEKIINQNCVIYFNGDKNGKLFSMLLQYKDHPFYFQEKDFLEIKINFFVDIKVPKTKIYLRFDKKSHSLLKNGTLPFYDLKFFQKNINKYSKNKNHFIWRKNGFIELPSKLKEKQERKKGK